MTLRTDLANDTASLTVHAAQHNEVNSRALPANHTGAATSTVTPDPVSGANSMTVIEVAADQAVIAIKITGDTYPRWILTSDALDGLYAGDGTYNPYGEAAILGLADNTFLPGDNRKGVQLGGGTHTGVAYLPTALSMAGFTFEHGTGAPGTRAGIAGQSYYFRTDTPSTANQRIYICTTTGAAGAAAWTGIL